MNRETLNQMDISDQEAADWWRTVQETNRQMGLGKTRGQRRAQRRAERNRPVVSHQPQPEVDLSPKLIEQRFRQVLNQSQRKEGT